MGTITEDYGSPRKRHFTVTVETDDPTECEILDHALSALNEHRGEKKSRAQQELAKHRAAAGLMVAYPTGGAS